MVKVAAVAEHVVAAISVTVWVTVLVKLTLQVVAEVKVLPVRVTVFPEVLKLVRVGLLAAVKYVKVQLPVHLLKTIKRVVTTTGCASPGLYSSLMAGVLHLIVVAVMDSILQNQLMVLPMKARLC